MKEKTLASLLAFEAFGLDGFVYSSWPYSCGLTEACLHAKRYQCPPPSRVDIEREDKQVTIKIKPPRGSGKRKPFTIRLWIA